MEVRNRDVLQSLPLLASILGNQYGVQVNIGGDQAYSQGNTIQLPSLPLDDDGKFLALARGFIDHEAAHVRFTENIPIRRARLDAVTKHVANSLEDWRVENRMAAIYPGCRQHFRWLVLNYCIPQNDAEAGYDNPVFCVLNYVMATVRTWDVPEVGSFLSTLRQHLAIQLPGLTSQLDTILGRVRAYCPDTWATIKYAREIVACLRQWQRQTPPPPPPNNDTKPQDSGSQTPDNSQPDVPEVSEPPDATEADAPKPADTTNQNEEEEPQESNSPDTDTPEPDEHESPTNNASTNSQDQEVKEHSHTDCKNETVGSETPANSPNERLDSDNGCSNAPPEQSPKVELGNLRDVLDTLASNIPKDIGERVAQELNELSPSETWSSRSISVAGIGKKYLSQLSEDTCSAAIRASNGLRHRLHGLLRAQAQKRCAVGRRGVLETGLLHRLHTGSPKLFRREVPHIATNTAVHILLDTSGSMADVIELACGATFATAKALEQTSGVNVGVTGFPADDDKDVYPIVRHGDRVTSNINVVADGSTPLAEALWWVMQQLCLQREPRKVLLVITDGGPDSKVAAQVAIKQAERSGVEIFGIGIDCDSVTDLFPHGRSCVISTIDELAPAMFRMLQQVLLQGARP